MPGMTVQHFPDTPMGATAEQEIQFIWIPVSFIRTHFLAVVVAVLVVAAELQERAVLEVLEVAARAEIMRDFLWIIHRGHSMVRLT
jgi:hypothetical protein